VQLMSPPRSPGTALRRRQAERRATRRARRLAGLALLAVVLVVTLLLTAFGSGKPGVVQAAPPAAAAASVLPAGPPSPVVVATQGNLQLHLPVAQNQVTAIGYHGAGEGVLPLSAIGHQGNEGFFARLFHGIFGGHKGGLTYYQLDGGTGSSTGELDVGAAPGTDVYSPVDGTVVGITPYVLNERQYGVRIDIQPSSTPSVVVSITSLQPDPALVVGSTVTAAGSRLGTVLDLSHVERQSLARYTQDAGNHVSIQVRPAATLAVP
jgi:hypothetical protein